MDTITSEKKACKGLPYLLWVSGPAAAPEESSSLGLAGLMAAAGPG